MSSRYRILIGGLLVVAVAAAGITLNFALLGLTQENRDPVGRLSPRAIFDTSTSAKATASSATTPAITADDEPRTVTDDVSGHGSDDGRHANDGDD
jgi:hypothetical protein